MNKYGWGKCPLRFGLTEEVCIRDDCEWWDNSTAGSSCPSCHCAVVSITQQANRSFDRQMSDDHDVWKAQHDGTE